MNMDPFFVWVESTALSQWIVGSPSMFAFPGILTVHAIGMGFAVGLSILLDLRVLGVAPGIPLQELRRFMPVLWLAFWMNAASGLLLLIGYPTKALTNPLFYLKLLLIGTGMALLAHMSRRIWPSFVQAPEGTREPLPLDDRSRADASPDLRRLAVISLVCWTAAITAGRLLAYTYTRLTATID